MSSSIPTISGSSFITESTTPRDTPPSPKTGKPESIPHLPARTLSSLLTTVLETPSPPRSSSPQTAPIDIPRLPISSLSRSAPEISSGSPPKTNRNSWKNWRNPFHSHQPVPPLPLDLIASSDNPAPTQHKKRSPTSHLQKNRPHVIYSSSSEEVRKTSLLGSFRLMKTHRSTHSHSAPTSPTSAQTLSPRFLGSAHLIPVEASSSQESVQQSIDEHIEFCREPTENDRHLFRCISTFCHAHPKEETLLAEFASHLFVNIPERNRDHLLYQLFIGTGKTRFFASLLKHLGADLDRTSKMLVDISLTSEQSVKKLIDRIIRYTQKDLVGQHTTTLFRSAYFSSYLCKHFGIKNEEEQLHQFYEFLLDQLKTLKNSQECFHLMDQTFTNRFNSEDPTFLALCPQDRSEFLIKRGVQISLFESFARTALDQFYQLEFSPQFRKILAQRRSMIQTFLDQSTPSSPTSSSSSFPSPSATRARIYVGEIPFLRIICPALPTLSLDAQEQPFLMTLAKLLIQLTNEVEFTGSPEDPLTQSLDQLYHRYLPDHRNFLERCSTYSKQNGS